MTAPNTLAGPSGSKESLLTILLTFLKVGAFTFGGGYAILPVIRQEVVINRRWVAEDAFADILIITQGMPGQLALNSAIQIGVRLRGTIGGLVAALGVTAPSVIILLIIAAWLYPLYRDNQYVHAVFYGLRPAVVALIAAAAINLGKDILHGTRGIILCAVLLITAIISQVHPILVLVAGGVAGLLVCKRECH
ncbi:MAG: chromate transporter [Firmicutes bacterium]|nr:chromate transporter [Bacillota bacterium]